MQFLVLFHFTYQLYNIPCCECNNTYSFCFQFFATINNAAIYIFEY